MKKRWSPGLLGIFGVFAVIGLIMAGTASGTCGQEVSATLTAPEGTTFTVGQTKGLTIDNNGQAFTVSGEDSGYFELVGTACGAIPAGGSCSTQRVKCVHEGESKMTITACGLETPAWIYLKCD
jgi:hypothetical protein